MLINEPNQINELTLEKLSSQEIFEQIKDWADRFLETDIFNPDALEMRRALQAKLSLAEAPEELKNQYQPLILIFQFYSLLNAGSDGRGELIKEQALAALRASIKVKELLADYFITRYDILFDHQERKNLLQNYRQNQEILAKQPISGWLSRYLSSIGLKTKRGAIERINFVNNSPEIKSLTPAEKSLLLKTLELFDWLEFPDEEKDKEDWDVIVADKDGQEMRMKMAEFNESKRKGKKIKTEARAPLSPLPEKPAGGIADYITKNHPTPSQFASYLKTQFPAPVDFKKVLKILNELKRQGYPQYLEIIYFDAADGQFKWKY